MRCVLVLLVCLFLSLSAYADEFYEPFDGPNGSFPSGWTWTGDPRGGGEFEIQDGTFTHVTGGHVHYFRSSDITGVGRYEFDAKDSYWEFGWRIATTDPNVGRCLVLYHNDYWGQWGYSLTEFSWWTLGGYPEGQYMWHNGSNIDLVHNWTGPLTGWRHVTIDDDLNRVEVRVDGELIFDEEVEPIPEGYIGLGSATGSSVLTPQYDNVRFFFNVPVDELSWARVKALYR